MTLRTMNLYISPIKGVEYKFIVRGNDISIEGNRAGHWRELTIMSIRSKSSKINKETDGVIYEYEIEDNIFYNRLTLATVGPNKVSIYKNGSIIKLYHKNSAEYLTYSVNHEKGPIDPVLLTKNRIEEEKQRKRQNRRDKIRRRGANLGGGYTISENNFTNLNRVISLYNTQGNITQPIGSLSRLTGVFGQADLYFGNIYLGGNWAWRQDETFGERPNSLGNPRFTYFRVEHRIFGGQLGLILHPNRWIKLALGGNIQFAKYRYLSETHASEDDRDGNHVDDLINPQTNTPKHAGGFAKLFLGNFSNDGETVAVLFVEGQYNVGLDDYNLFYVNKAFNPTNFAALDIKTLNQDNSYYAVKFGFLFGLGF